MKQYKIKIERRAKNVVIGEKVETLELPENYRSLIGTTKTISEYPLITETIVDQIDITEPQIEVINDRLGVNLSDRSGQPAIAQPKTDYQLLEEKYQIALKAILETRKLITKSRVPNARETLDQALLDIKNVN